MEYKQVASSVPAHVFLQDTCFFQSNSSQKSPVRRVTNAHSLTRRASYFAYLQQLLLLVRVTARCSHQFLYQVSVVLPNAEVSILGYIDLTLLLLSQLLFETIRAPIAKNSRYYTSFITADRDKINLYLREEDFQFGVE